MIINNFDEVMDRVMKILYVVIGFLICFVLFSEIVFKQEVKQYINIWAANGLKLNEMGCVHVNITAINDRDLKISVGSATTLGLTSNKLN